MSNSFHSAIPSFSPVSIRAMDNFSNVLSEINTIDELSDWIYEEKTCYIGYQEAREFADTFIAQFNDMMKEGKGYVQFSFGPTSYPAVYIINAL